MIHPGFDEANRKSRFDKRIEKAKLLNDRLVRYLNDLDRDPFFTEKQKSKIRKTLTKGLALEKPIKE